MSVRDAILSFMKFREAQETEPSKEGIAKKEGPMWIECEFSRLRVDEEQQRQQAKPKNTPMDVKRQEEFLKD
jgi:hypothetical protein